MRPLPRSYFTLVFCQRGFCAYRFSAETNSLTAVDVNGKSLTIRQISAQGKELDRFTITK